MEVIMIRHTRVDVVPGTCYGQSDVPLADTFEQEASLTRAALEEYAPFDAVYSSPLSRALRLAAFCGYPEAKTDSRLMEMSMGEWELRRYDEIDDPALKEWMGDYLHLPTRGGESFPQLYARVAGFLDELRGQPYAKVAVFSHGGPLVCAGIYAGLFGEENSFAHQLPYGGIQQIIL